MKKLSYLFLAVGSILLASCAKTETVVIPSEKATGIYTGTFTGGGIDTTGTATVVANGDNMVNISLSSAFFPPGTSINGVSVALDGDNVNFNYSSTSTTDGTAIALSPGTLIANSFSCAFTVYFAAGNQNFGFSGQK